MESYVIQSNVSEKNEQSSPGNNNDEVLLAVQEKGCNVIVLL